MTIPVKKSHEKQVIETANTRYLIHVSSYDTDGKISLYHATFRNVGNNMNLHYHKKLTETFTILQGKFLFNVNHEVHELSANDTIVVKPMEIHGFRALVPNSEMLISFSDSANRDSFFIELADWVNKGKKMDEEQRMAFYARFDQYYPD